MIRFSPLSFYFLLSISFPNFEVFDEKWNTLTLNDLPGGYFLIFLHSSRENAHPVNLVKAIRYLNKVYTKFPHIIGMVEGYTFGSLTHLKEKNRPNFPIYFLDVDKQLMQFFFPSNDHRTTFILWNPQKEEELRTHDLVLIYLLLSEWTTTGDKSALLFLLRRFQEQTQDKVTPPAFHTAERIGGYSPLLMHYLKFQMYHQVENLGASAENLRFLPPEVIYLLWEDFSESLERTFFRLPAPLSDQDLHSLRQLVDHLLSFDAADFQVAPELKDTFFSTPMYQHFLASVMFTSGLVALLQQKPGEAVKTFRKLLQFRKGSSIQEFYRYSLILAGDTKTLEEDLLPHLPFLIKQLPRIHITRRNEIIQKLYFLERQYKNASAPIPFTFDFYLYLWLKYGFGEDLSASIQKRAEICIQKSPDCKRWIELAEKGAE
ncbi:MAG: hypothetical protein V2G48_01370 [bacterium JZ-2024 1]